MTSGMSEGFWPDKSPDEESVKLSYSGSWKVPAKVSSNGSIGVQVRSSSTPVFDCLPALASAKPVPVNTLDWKPSIFWSNRARLNAIRSNWALMPASSTAASSGPAKRVPVVRFGTARPASRIGEPAGAGEPAGEPGMKSVGNGRESRDRFQDVALKPG